MSPPALWGCCCIRAGHVLSMTALLSLPHFVPLNSKFWYAPAQLFSQTLFPLQCVALH